ncbi:Putative corA, transmembrane region [Septoria linicola]|uniref:CorA, transmembrane region n=1 Tax=Septoria linicola TaxID=215465 RepID=A0A9Q9AQS8_9PEZI|nr:putative corA, transmembrane region [Septoria linicola]USW50382.1 Putative corA, transmembrane region [Septoria linicola]
MEETARLEKFEITDSRLEHNNWQFPPTLKTRPLRKLEEEDFLINHKIDRSYDDSTVRFKLLAGNAVSANLVDTSKLPFGHEIVETVKKQGWISDEYEHLWRRDEGGSAALTSHGILTFILQTPRDGKSFCSLSLVNRERSHCGGLFVADEHYSLSKLLSSQQYLNRHPKVPRDFAILPLQILVHHVDESQSHARELSRQLTNTERRLADGRISLDDNGDYKLLNRFNLEHVRLQRRSNFEVELGNNLLKYLDAYQKLWTHLWEGGTSYLEDMREKVEQQMRYSEQVQKDLNMMPRRIDNQSHAIFNFMAQRDNKINLQVAESSRKIAEESRIDNLLNVKLARVTAQMAEETRQDSAAMKTIATLTLIFLPGTAVASFFGMDGMFNWYPQAGEKIASPYIYIFFVVTVPLTLVVYALWLWWFARMEKEHKKNAPDLNFDMYEQEVTRRMQTAKTNSWTLEKQATVGAAQQA